MTTQRQKREIRFHDDYARGVKDTDIVIKRNPSIAAQEYWRALKLFGNIKNKRILDLGCGFGDTATIWALRGAKVWGIDISPVCIKVAKKVAKRYKVSSFCHFSQMASENLKFPDSYFDFVFGDAILHHVNIPKTLKEVRRVLKPNGIVVFIDPLSYNPVINIYRKMAKHVRTEDEKPLTFEDIEGMKSIFRRVRHEEYHLTTLSLYVWFYLVERVDPNKERYWKRFRAIDGAMELPLKIFTSIDKVLLGLIYPLRYLCWNTLVILEK